MAAEWYEQLVELQLERNRDSWAELTELGFDGDAELRLSFLYAAPGEQEARDLLAFLREETDYDVDARVQVGGDGARGWFVAGTTQPTRLTLALLDDWTAWMIAAGAAEGPCAFDGWAAQSAG